MALYPKVFTTSGAVTAGGLHIHKLDLVPDGAGVEVRILRGTDSSGTELYRMKAIEGAALREFNGLVITGPVYVYFYDGAGALTIVSEEQL